MVTAGRFAKLTVALPVVALLIVGFLFVAGAAAAQEQGEGPTIVEEYRITLNDVGDARIEDIIEYGDEDFETMQKVVDENPTFLSRKYTSGEDIIEVEDFHAEMNDTDSSVVITFDSPGYAYNMGDHWVLYGYPEEPSMESDSKFEFETEGYTNSEFTLFTDQPVRSTTLIEFPEAVSNARYDKGESAIKYDMPAAAAQLGFFSDNRLPLTIVFGGLAVLFLALLVFVLTRETVSRPGAPVPWATDRRAPQGIHAPGTPDTTPAGPPPVPTAQEIPETPPPPAGDIRKSKPGGEPGSAVRYCKSCGGEARGEKFCTNCGAELQQ
jgi:hypothetical protein